MVGTWPIQLKKTRDSHDFPTFALEVVDITGYSACEF